MIKPKDTYNKHITQRQKYLGLFTLIQVLIIEFYKKDNWYIHCIEDDENHIKQLLFAKVFSEKILKYNYEVLLIDVTYKTNKYKILLIIISRLMSLNISYYIAFVFVFKKIYEIYKWLPEYVKDFYEWLDISDPNVILIDVQNSLIQAIIIIYLLVLYFLCF